MNLKSLITVLVLASSTVATASSASAAPFKLKVGSSMVVRPHASVAVHAPAVRVTRAPARIEPVRIEAPRREQVAVRNDARPIVERPSHERTIVERPIIRPIYRPFATPSFHHRFFGFYPVLYDQAPVIVDTNYVGASPFVAGVMVVNLNGTVGNLELDTLGGATYVKNVAIQYSNGGSQVIEVDHAVDSTTPAIDLTTDGTPISNIMIYGSGAGVSVATV